MTEQEIRAAALLAAATVLGSNHRKAVVLELATAFEPYIREGVR